MIFIYFAFIEYFDDAKSRYNLILLSRCYYLVLLGLGNKNSMWTKLESVFPLPKLLETLTQLQMFRRSQNICFLFAIPLTRIINASITEGKYPEIWKCGIVTPVLKKGSSKDKTNYRPVSCLSVLSKVLEKIVCSQVTKFLEDND